MADHAQRRRLDEIEQRIAATPSLETLAEIDARIAQEHSLELAAYAAGDDGQAFFYVLDIERLRNLRRIVEAGAAVRDELRRTKLRHLSQRHAEATWRGDRDAAALLRDAMDRLEREGPRN